ncbi:MAG TPA: NUDIX hydrolase [Solirubrobacteraceae bacterium]
MTEAAYRLPKIAASAGAMVFDRSGRLLVLKPSYKPKWTIPGGQIEADGESPWEACRRETLEECGLHVKRGRLVCVDFLRPRPDPHRPGGVRFLFHCGVLADEELSAIKLQAEEILEHRFVELEEAYSRLSGPLRRRVRAAAASKRCLYLEEGRRVGGVR